MTTSKTHDYVKFNRIQCEPELYDYDEFLNDEPESAPTCCCDCDCESEDVWESSPSIENEEMLELIESAPPYRAWHNNIFWLCKDCASKHN